MATVAPKQTQRQLTLGSLATAQTGAYPVWTDTGGRHHPRHRDEAGGDGGGDYDRDGEAVSASPGNGTGTYPYTWRGTPTLT